jgi:hypothetical protein
MASHPCGTKKREAKLLQQQAFADQCSAGMTAPGRHILRQSACAVGKNEVTGGCALTRTAWKIIANSIA